jgi:hydrogenase nickel incorporation protein HypB
MSIITLERKVLQKNDDIAAENRARFREKHMLALNLLSSPGSGKTSLLERTIESLSTSLRIGVIEGDVQTDNDARRIAEYDVPVVQIVTNGACHLEAGLVRDALAELDSELDICIIENVGNLVCPASYDLGEHHKVVMLSTTEGDDKPDKYPAMFRRSDVLIINKTDLLPYVQFNMDACIARARNINPGLTVFTLSCTTGDGMDGWLKWLASQTQKIKV